MDEDRERLVAILHECRKANSCHPLAWPLKQNLASGGAPIVAGSSSMNR